jgi:hypothetical protein
MANLVLGVKSILRNRQYYRIPATERFMAKVAKQDDGCWYWTARLNNKGYGEFALNGVTRGLAHRAAYILFKGQIPDDLNVLHRCDMPACVNPDHLFLGSQADNVLDMVRKGRTRSKLTPEQVEEIRASTEKARVLAARYGLKSHKSILNIRHGRTFVGVGQ